METEFFRFIFRGDGVVELGKFKNGIIQQAIAFLDCRNDIDFLVIKFDWRLIINHQGIIIGLYFLIILLLALTYFFAPVIRGTRSWLPIGPYQFQASEFAKIALIIIFANFFRKKHISIARISNLLVSFIYFLVPAILTLIQPDLGSALVLFAIWFRFLWSRNSLAPYSGFFLFFLALGTFAWFYGLHNYQKERIIGVFCRKEILWALIIMSFNRKSPLVQPDCSVRDFSRERKSSLVFAGSPDGFYFASVIEEFGLLSGFLLLIAFAIMIFEIIKIGFNSNNNFNKFVCLGSAIFL